jgi:hypothetical protein
VRLRTTAANRGSGEPSSNGLTPTTPLYYPARTRIMGEAFLYHPSAWLPREGSRIFSANYFTLTRRG